ncbi:MAG: L-fucose/L-arabinose isomerase family protein [Eubacteriales bacterium]|nr:L-fucose/L-arabinose isomerase family protein [Eubacteriales bacterium]
MIKKPLIAVVSLGHYVYFEQFEGLREELELKADAFINYLQAYNADIYYTGYIDRPERAFHAVKECKKRDPDMLFILFSTYLPSSVAAPFAYYLDIPQVLVGIQPLSHLDYNNTTTYMQLCNDDICAMPEAAGVYERLGKSIPPCFVTSADKEEEINRELAAWVSAASAKTAFKYATIGYLGHTYEGMYDMHTDPTAFTGTFGSHVKMLEMCELAEYVSAVGPDETQAKIDLIENTFEICDPSCDPLTDYVKRADLEWSAKIACALDKLIENNGLTALAYYYKGENDNLYERIAANMIIGNTLLTSAGIPLAGEADLKTAAAMLIMNRIGGGGSFAEIHPFDTRDNIVLVGHDGPHNISISWDKPRLRKLKKYHGKPGSGIGVEFSIKNGAVTILSINVKRDGSFKMVAAAGMSVEGDIPRTGNTNTRCSFGDDITGFLSRWCEAGPTHHFALGCGNRLEELKRFSRMTGIELVVVS